LLLDEPTSALDDDAILAVERVLSERLEQGAILLIATHNEAQALRLGARILAFEGGVAVEVNP
jgi:ABC-type phosphate transport system ATPase subunit